MLFMKWLNRLSQTNIYRCNMEQKPGWTYRFIESLNMQIAINDTSGIMYTEDKVRYSAEEQKLLQSIDYALPLSVHLVKKVFNGTIVSL